MDTFIKFSFPVAAGPERDILLARLDGAGFEGFEETDQALLGYIPAALRAGVPDTELRSFYYTWTEDSIPPENWNARWEASFQPVVVGKFCTVRADFHPPAAGTEYEIVVTPKMSFGTGHHATTYTMIERMAGLSFRGKKVLDFGTGTGVLAILAAQMGAVEVLAIDNEDWAVENARENVTRNEAHAVTVAAGSLERISPPAHRFDIIIANINRHILLQYMSAMSGALEPQGELLLSGILVDDEAIIDEAAKAAGLDQGDKKERSGWLVLRYSKGAAV